MDVTSCSCWAHLGEGPRGNDHMTVEPTGPVIVRTSDVHSQSNTVTDPSFLLLRTGFQRAHTSFDVFTTSNHLQLRWETSVKLPAASATYRFSDRRGLRRRFRRESPLSPRTKTYRRDPQRSPCKTKIKPGLTASSSLSDSARPTACAVM